MKTFRHLPTEVEAVQVIKPYAGITKNFPRSHPIKHESGRIYYWHLVDAVGKTKAYPGDWVLRREDGTVEILTDEQFAHAYEDSDVGTD